MIPVLVYVSGQTLLVFVLFATTNLLEVLSPMMHPKTRELAARTRTRQPEAGRQR